MPIYRVPTVWRRGGEEGKKSWQKAGRAIEQRYPITSVPVPLPWSHGRSELNQLFVNFVLSVKYVEVLKRILVKGTIMRRN